MVQKGSYFKGDGGIRLGWMGRDSGISPPKSACSWFASKSQWVLARLHSSNKNAKNPNLNQQLRDSSGIPTTRNLEKTYLFWGDNFLARSKSQAFEPHVGGNSLNFFRIRVLGAFVAHNLRPNCFSTYSLFRKVLVLIRSTFGSQAFK